MKRSLVISAVFCVAAIAALVAMTFSSRAATDGAAPCGVQVDSPQQIKNGAYVSRSTATPLLPLRAEVLARPAKQSVMAGALAQGQSLNLAIRQGMARYGDTDGRVAALADRADAVCREDPDPYGSVDPRYVDPTRAWAIQRVLDLCQGFSRKAFSSLDPPRADSAGAALKRLGEQAAVAAANKTIASGWNRVALAEAGIFLFSTHRFPFKEVAPGADRHFGLMDLESAWFMASDLALCGQVGGCGSNSLLVADYCKQRGCMPSSNLIQAYERNLSAEKYELVLEFATWIQRQRTPVSN